MTTLDDLKRAITTLEEAEARCDDDFYYDINVQRAKYDFAKTAFEWCDGWHERLKTAKRPVPVLFEGTEGMALIREYLK